MPQASVTAFARCMAAAGAKVLLVGRRTAELRQAAGEIGALATPVAHDITRLEAAPELIARAKADAGSEVTILINNAGIHLKNLL